MTDIEALRADIVQHLSQASRGDHLEQMAAGGLMMAFNKMAPASQQILFTDLARDPLTTKTPGLPAGTAQGASSLCPTVPERASGAWAWVKAQRARLTATWMLHSNAVILDVETTGLQGRVCEIAVIDTAGHVLLDTLVDPQEPIPADAADVHGITDEDLAGAPIWARIAPHVEQLLRGRTVIAYNAPFDRGRLEAEQARAGHPSPRRWWCLMRARADVEHAPRRALHGGHRAAGDCYAALEVLRTIALRRHGDTSS